METRGITINMKNIIDWFINVAVGVFTLYVVNNNTVGIVTEYISIGNVLVAMTGIVLFNMVKKVVNNGTK